MSVEGRTMRRLASWVEGELREVEANIASRKRRGLATWANVERRKTLRQFQSAMDTFHREESQR